VNKHIPMLVVLRRLARVSVVGCGRCLFRVWLKHGGAVVDPDRPRRKRRSARGQIPVPLRVSSFFYLDLSVPLGIYAATVSAVLRLLGAVAAGSYIAHSGGCSLEHRLMILASALGLLSVPEVASSVGGTERFYFMTLCCRRRSVAVVSGVGRKVYGTVILSVLLPSWWCGWNLYAAAGEFSSTTDIVGCGDNTNC